MAAALDRAAFFAAVRANPFGSLSKTQVSGTEIILDACPPDLPLDHLAYCLATTFWETARTMQPIEEYGRGKGRAYGPTGFWGRGYVQLTWQANYDKATRELRARGYLDPTQDLVRTPNLALDPSIAAAIMFLGMQEGWFTTKKLSDFFGPAKSDPYNARRIINGTDKADTIAGLFKAFQGALQAAGYRPGGIAVAVPTPRVDSKPLPPPAITPPTQPGPTVTTGGFWAGLKSIFTKKAS